MTTKKKRLANQLTQLINSKLEKQLKAEIQLFFQKQMDEVLSAFDEYYTDTLLLQGHINLILSPIHELQKEYYDLLLKYNTEIYNRGKEQGRRQVDGMALKSAKPLKWHHDENKPTDLFGTLPTSEQHLTSYTFTASESTMNRVDGEINRILTEGYRDGLGVKDVRNRIMERYQQFTGWEANRIARTEMQTAHNMGVMQTYQEMGVEYKEWRSAHDKRTRRSHSLLDGEVAPLDKPFSNGLMYPGDKSGPIEEWINCRCSAVPYLMPPGQSAPVGQTQFRAGDLVKVKEPNYGKLLQKETGGALNWQQYKQILHGKPLEQVGIGVVVQETQTENPPNVKNIVGEQTSNIPSNVRSNLDEFASATKNHNREFSQYYTESGKISELNKGASHKAYRNPKVTDWVDSQAKQGEIFHFVHNHPTSYLNGRTLLSSEDITIFKEERDRHNLKSFIAEGKNVRVIIGKSDNYDEFSRSQQDKALTKAWHIYEEEYARSTKRGTVEYYNEIVEKLNDELNKGGMYYRVEERTVESNGEFPKANAVMEKSEIEKLEEKLRQTVDEKERIKILKKLDELSGGFYGY